MKINMNEETLFSKQEGEEFREKLLGSKEPTLEFLEEATKNSVINEKLFRKLKNIVEYEFYLLVKRFGYNDAPDYNIILKNSSDLYTKNMEKEDLAFLGIIGNLCCYCDKRYSEDIRKNKLKFSMEDTLFYIRFRKELSKLLELNSKNIKYE